MVRIQFMEPNQAVKKVDQVPRPVPDFSPWSSQEKSSALTADKHELKGQAFLLLFTPTTQFDQKSLAALLAAL